MARRSSRTSRSSSAIRVRSWLGTPGRCPSSTSASLTQLRSVSGCTPSCCATGSPRCGADRSPAAPRGPSGPPAPGTHRGTCVGLPWLHPLQGSKPPPTWGGSGVGAAGQAGPRPGSSVGISASRERAPLSFALVAALTLAGVCVVCAEPLSARPILPAGCGPVARGQERGTHRSACAPGVKPCPSPGTAGQASGPNPTADLAGGPGGTRERSTGRIRR